MATSKQPDIEGTKEDGSLHVEGEGADTIHEHTMAKGEGYNRQQVNSMRNPCVKFGHRPLYTKGERGVHTEVEVSPRQCRYCQQPY